jgi:signal transduction histidine kinase
MSRAQAAAGSAGTFVFPRRRRSATGRIRVTVFVCVVLICGSFASAAVIQMRLDRMHALSHAALFGQRRAQEMATDIAASLERYKAIGRAFASIGKASDSSAALLEAGGPPLRNIAVFDGGGRLESEMNARPGYLPPVPARLLAQARHRNLVVPAPDGRSFSILLALQAGTVAVQIDPARLLESTGMGDGLLLTASGRLIAPGADWTAVPALAELALEGASADSRLVELTEGPRLISLHQVGRWPLVVASSLRVEEALGVWYGTLPLYLFFILGPAFAGAALAVLFVGVFERHAKAAATIRALRSTRPDEARLLVRLADAERRAAEADRAKSRFVAQVSHELRTPLNAIIGFSEVIEGGVFGVPGHPKYVEYARDIGIAGRELHTKIGSVLEFAALDSYADATRPHDHMRIVDAVRVARAAVDERTGAARTRGLKLVISLPEAASARAEPAALERTLAHLLDNALAYTPNGGTVRLEMRAEARDIVIRVRDTGPGFAKGESAGAGRPFQRFARPGAPGGMGVGLAIAMGLARRMSGTLSLSSAPGQGTIAELRLAAAVP